MHSIMHKLLYCASAILATASISARAEPPADLAACLKLTAETVKETKVETEADYVKFYSKKLELDAACGAKDFASAERIAKDVQSMFKAQ